MKMRLFRFFMLDILVWVSSVISVYLNIVQNTYVVETEIVSSVKNQSITECSLQCMFGNKNCCAIGFMREGFQQNRTLQLCYHLRKEAIPFYRKNCTNVNLVKLDVMVRLSILNFFSYC